jgi:uncharacterized membrane protein
MTEAGSSEARIVRRAPRWLLVALFASLAVNLVIVGSVAGAVWRHRGPPAGAGVVIPNLLGYASTFAPERRKQIWELTRDERSRMRPFRREVRAAREETIKALATQPFDRQQFLAAQSKLAEAENRTRAAVQDLYVKIAEGLTAEERQAFAHWRDHRRTPIRNLLDEPDHQAGDPPAPR